MLVDSVARLAMLFGLFAWLHVTNMVALLVSALAVEFTLDSASAAPW
jgi:hypothetical protein